MNPKKPIPWSIVGLFIALLTCDTAAQLFFKKSTMGLGEFPTNSLSAALNYVGLLLVNPMVLAAVTTIILAFLIWLAIISHLDLSKAHPITCLVYGTVAVSSSLLFHETLTAMQCTGVVLIMIGSYIASEHK